MCIRDSSISSVLIDTSGDYDLLSQHVEPLGDAFTLSSAVEDRNIRATLALRFYQGEYRIDTTKQVVVRNVP